MPDSQNHRLKIRLTEQGLHLFDRKTGTNILIDEVTFPKNEWTICPRQVSIALTNTCNLFCSHCYASKVSSSLNKEDVQSWLLELDRAGCFGIGFGGGEPTLHPDFVELCQFGHDKTSLAISFTTHGHHLTQKLIDQIKDSVNFTRISIDGTWDRYEKIRGISFQTLLNKLNDLGKKLNYGVNYVVNETTISDLDELAKIAQEAIDNFNFEKVLTNEIDNLLDEAIHTALDGMDFSKDIRELIYKEVEKRINHV